MKKLHYIKLLLGAIILALHSFAQDKVLKTLLYTRQYPQLELALLSPKTGKEDKIIYQAFLLNAYNKPEESDNLLAKIFARKIKENDDSLQFYLHRIDYDNKVKLNDYRSAYQASEFLLKKYPKFLDSSEFEDQKEESKIWKFLTDIPKQKVVIGETAVLPVKHDLAGLWNIPVNNGDSTYEFIFDTGAGISTITDTYARKLKLDIIKNSAVSIHGGINGISTNAKLGIAKQLQIGKLAVQNAVFLIFPDSALSFAGGAYKINGIIGLPIIKDFNEVIISKNEMTIPLKKSIGKVKHNMILDLQNPVIYIDFKGESLPCTFDCGAQTSLFSDNFYNRFKQDLKMGGRYDSTRIGGAGGNRTLQLLEVPVLDLSINNLPIRLLKAQLSLEPLPAEKKCYYGNIGQDVINQFDIININFLTSSISFINKKNSKK